MCECTESKRGSKERKREGVTVELKVSGGYSDQKNLYNIQIEK